MKLGNYEVVLDASGTAFIPDLSLLAVADLHFEKSTAFQARGIFLPPFDTRETLERLRRVIEYYQPARIIALGDSFHDAGAGERMREEERAILNGLVAHANQWVWITGNHDPEIAKCVLGERRREMTLNGIAFRHRATQDALFAMNGEIHGEMSGHYHPKARVAANGTLISGPCFIEYETGRGTQLILPSFGAFTGSMDVMGRDFLTLFPGDFCAHLIRNGNVFAFPKSALKRR